MNIYDYLYYKLYSFISGTNKSIPEWSTMIFLSVLEFLNIGTIVLLLNLNSIDTITENANNIFISLILGLLILNYFIFLLNKRYIKILKKYNRNKSIFDKGGLIVILYVIASILIFIYVIKTI